MTPLAAFAGSPPISGGEWFTVPLERGTAAKRRGSLTRHVEVDFCSKPPGGEFAHSIRVFLQPARSPLSVLLKMLPGEYRLCRHASFAACLPFAFPIICVSG